MRLFRAYLPVFLWMLMIFVASGRAGSVEVTSPMIRAVVRWFNPNASEAAVKSVSFLVRKGAHLTEYAILAMLIWRARRIQLNEQSVWLSREMFPIVLVCALYAAGDELHQSFVPQRQGQVLDVLIDTTGAILGMLVVRSACELSANRTRR